MSCRQLPLHPNVVQVFGVSLDGPQPVIVLEYCNGGSLDKLLCDSKVKLNEEYKIQLVRGIAAGLFHLYKHNIVHRDLAARNILLANSNEPKISLCFISLHTSCDHLYHINCLIYLLNCFYSHI